MWEIFQYPCYGGYIYKLFKEDDDGVFQGPMLLDGKEFTTSYHAEAQELADKLNGDSDD